MPRKSKPVAILGVGSLSVSERVLLFCVATRPRTNRILPASPAPGPASAPAATPSRPDDTGNERWHNLFVPPVPLWLLFERPSVHPRMDRADISFWLSITGFVTSSVLAIFKGLEFYSSRRAAFTADIRLTGSEQEGNEIVLLNKSSIPATISYFELEWTVRQRLLGWPIPFLRKVMRTSSPIGTVPNKKLKTRFMSLQICIA